MPRRRVPQARAATCNPPSNAPCNAPPCSAPLQRATVSLARQSCEEGASAAACRARTLPDSHLAPTVTPALLLPHSHLIPTSLTSSLPRLSPPCLPFPSSPHLPPPHLTYLLFTSPTSSSSHLPASSPGGPRSAPPSSSGSRSSRSPSSRSRSSRSRSSRGRRARRPGSAQRAPSSSPESVRVGAPCDSRKASGGAS